jgi:hypothetical protein
MQTNLVVCPASRTLPLGGLMLSPCIQAAEVHQKLEDTVAQMYWSAGSYLLLQLLLLPSVADAVSHTVTVEKHVEVATAEEFVFAVKEGATHVMLTQDVDLTSIPQAADNYIIDFPNSLVSLQVSLLQYTAVLSALGCRKHQCICFSKGGQPRITAPDRELMRSCLC